MPMTGAERQKKYIEKLKNQNPEKYEEKRKKHLEKVKQRQKKLLDLNDSEKEARRQKWKEANDRRKEKKIQEAKQKKEENLMRRREIYAAKRALFSKAENTNLKHENEKLHVKVALSAAEKLKQYRELRERMRANNPEKFEKAKLKNAAQNKARKKIGECAEEENKIIRKECRNRKNKIEDVVENRSSIQTDDKKVQLAETKNSQKHNAIAKNTYEMKT